MFICNLYEIQCGFCRECFRGQDVHHTALLQKNICRQARVHHCCGFSPHHHRRNPTVIVGHVWPRKIYVHYDVVLYARSHFRTSARCGRARYREEFKILVQGNTEAPHAPPIRPLLLSSPIKWIQRRAVRTFENGAVTICLSTPRPPPKMDKVFLPCLIRFATRRSCMAPTGQTGPVSPCYRRRQMWPHRVALVNWHAASMASDTRLTTELMFNTLSINVWSSTLSTLSRNDGCVESKRITT